MGVQFLSDSYEGISVVHSIASLADQSTRMQYLGNFYENTSSYLILGSLHPSDLILF